MYKNKKLFVLGMGKSGVAVSKLLCKEASILLTDTKCDNQDLLRELEDLGINVVITNNQAEMLTEHFDYLIKSPAIFPDNEVVLKAKKLNIPVTTEMEVAYNMLPKNVKIIGITGSNGKTTTASLTYEILKVAGMPVHLGGNIGVPLCQIINDVKSGDILVLEISSHQLIDFDTFKTDISILTNLSPVHLDMFKTYEHYKKNKLKIFNHHAIQDVAILNMNDLDVVNLTKNIASQKIYFSCSKKADIYIQNDQIYYGDEAICELNDIRIKGIHNYENVMCAIGVAKVLNIDNQYIKKALDNFSGVEHRMEFVRRLNEREFYNDSKSTNNTSTIAALSAFTTPIILLLGGLDRGQTFDELNGHMDHVKEVICYGQTKDKINDFCKDSGIAVTMTNDLDEAIKLAYNLSEKGDTILFSPACASQDQFASFEQRGEEFKSIVESFDESFL